MIQKRNPFLYIIFLFGLLLAIPSCGAPAELEESPSDEQPSAAPSTEPEKSPFDKQPSAAPSAEPEKLPSDEQPSAAPSTEPEESPSDEQPSAVTFPVTITDSLGNEVKITSINHVISLYGSFTEACLLAGCPVTGTTQDAIEERRLVLSEEVAMVGTVKEPNLERIISLEPDFILLSADIASQAGLDNTLSSMGIPHAYFRIDTFKDYRCMMEELVKLTGREDLYEKNAVEVEKKIETILAAVPKDASPSVLLIRAFATGAKAKASDNFTGMMLEELRTCNIAAIHKSLLEDLSMETIILEDPDFIFVTTMGDETTALKNLADQIESNPAWSSLSAVQNNRYAILPKELFHYKPNARWDEAYEYLAKILYPEIFN